MLIGLDLPLVGGGTEAGIQPPHQGNYLSRGETFKVASEVAYLWQPKWNENQTGLAAAIHTPDRDADPLEDAAAGSWSLGSVEQSQGEGCWELEFRDCGAIPG